MGLYLSVFWVLPALAVRFARAKGFPLFVALPILVVGWERLQGFPMGGFFWRFLGHSQYQNLAMIQIADLVGAAGVSFVVAHGQRPDRRSRSSHWPSRRVGRPHETGQIWPALHDSRRPSGRIVVVGVVATILVVAGTVLYGQWRLGADRAVRDRRPAGGVAAIERASVRQAELQRQRGQLFDELMDNSKAAAAAGAELIVWPETMVQGILDPALWPYLERTRRGLDEDKAFHQALGEHAKDTAYAARRGPRRGDSLRTCRGKPTWAATTPPTSTGRTGPATRAATTRSTSSSSASTSRSSNGFPWLFEQLKMFLPEG